MNNWEPTLDILENTPGTDDRGPSAGRWEHGRPSPRFAGIAAWDDCEADSGRSWL